MNGGTENSAKTVSKKEKGLSECTEKGGFEPPRRVNTLPAFQASPFSHLGTSPFYLHRIPQNIMFVNPDK